MKVVVHGRSMVEPAVRATLTVCSDGAEICLRIDYRPGREAIEYLQEKGFRQRPGEASWILS